MKLLCSPLFRKISSSVQTQFLTCRLWGSCTASAFGTSKGLPSQSGANSACVTYPLPIKSFKLQEITHNSKKKVSGHLKCCPRRPMLFFIFFFFHSALNPTEVNLARLWPCWVTHCPLPDKELSGIKSSNRHRGKKTHEQAAWPLTFREWLLPCSCYSDFRKLILKITAVYILFTWKPAEFLWQERLLISKLGKAIQRMPT